ncbi:MAG: TraR/DksA C4-type zinc finger protein [Calditrichaceae bacterium]|nr:TraR/DksA C4-type zinc finger protein [Calditrichaceae bacterium]
MDASKLEYFKQILLNKRKETKENRDRLWNSICQSYDSDDDSIRHPNDVADHSTSLDENEYSFQFLEREDKYIQKLDKALEMIKTGNYGICRVCGQEINEERLKAVPTTNICINCKKFVSHNKRTPED